MLSQLRRPTREERTPIKAKKEGRAPLALSNPTAIFESNGELYIVSNAQGKVYKILRNGHVVVIAGGGEETLDGKPAHLSKLNGPFGVCVSGRNEVFITEREGNRIRKIDKFGNIYTIAGTGKEQEPYTQVIGNEDGDALKCNLFGPTGIIVTELDQIIFVDSGNEMIRMVQLDGNIKTLLSNVRHAQNICRDENGIIFFAEERNVISKLLPNGNVEKFERKLAKQMPGKIYPFTEIKFHEVFDIKIRNEIVYYSERLHLRNFDNSGNDSVFAKLEAVQKPLVMMKHKKNCVAICPSNNGTIYMGDDMRGTIWIAGPKPHELKEMMVKCEIPFNIKEYPHIGPIEKKRVKRCLEFSDIFIHFHD